MLCLLLSKEVLTGQGCPHVFFFFSIVLLLESILKNKKNKIIIAHIYFMFLGADTLEGSLIISFDMYSYPMSGHYYLIFMWGN